VLPNTQNDVDIIIEDMLSTLKLHMPDGIYDPMVHMNIQGSRIILCYSIDKKV
jgi:hypothetical protein